MVSKARCNFLLRRAWPDCGRNSSLKPSSTEPVRLLIRWEGMSRPWDAYESTPTYGDDEADMPFLGDKEIGKRQSWAYTYRERKPSNHPQFPVCHRFGQEDKWPHKLCRLHSEGIG